MAVLKLNNEVGIDLQKLVESRAVFLANSGAGKSWLIRRVAEQAVDKIQVIILDPEGEFASLREKFDFILAGKDMDVPVETRSAAMLATKLLELNKSAVIDLYELHPQERQRYVKFFCDALVNCPKNLYHPVLIILDEAHEYVPEGKPSEATWSVEALASKGRKRGQCLILASQRISKLSKNAAAECNNKLIGRASQDIDMKRAGDELGFSKEKMVELRQLKPGEFFTFGPAIGDEVVKVKIGEVETTHAKIGYQGVAKTPPASDVIKKVLDGLKDLPAEAQREAQTMAESKKEIARLKTALTIANKLHEPHASVQIKKIEVPAVGKRALEGMKLSESKLRKMVAVMKDGIGVIEKSMDKLSLELKKVNHPLLETTGRALVAKYLGKENPYLPESYKKTFEEGGRVMGIDYGYEAPPVAVKIELDKGKDVDAWSKISGPEQRIINAIAWMESIGNMEPEQAAIAFLAGYTFGGGAFNNPKGSLRAKGLVGYRGNVIVLTETGRALAQVPEVSLTTAELHDKVLKILPGPEQKLLKPLLAAYPNDMSSEELAAASGYSHGAGAFNNPKGRLRRLGLIEYLIAGRVKAKSLLFIE